MTWENVASRRKLAEGTVWRTPDRGVHLGPLPGAAAPPRFVPDGRSEPVRAARSPVTPPDVVLLDVDGTLVDSAAGISRSAAAALAHVGRPPPTPAQQRAFIGPPLDDAFGLLGLSGAELDDAVAAYRRHYLVDGILDYRVYPGVPDALDRLAGSGLRLAVATSKRTASARRVLDHAGLSGYLTSVAGSEPDGSRPDKAAVMAAALDELGNPDPDRVVMVGDREHDAHGARALSVGFVGVTWGFGGRGELVAAGATLLVDTPRALTELVLGDGAAPSTRDPGPTPSGGDVHRR